MGLITSSRGCPMLVRIPRRPGRLWPQVLVVISVAGVIGGLFLSAVAKVRSVARRTQCQNNLKQVAMAVHGFTDTNTHFPPGTLLNPDLPPEQRLSWMVAIIPHVEATDLSSRIEKTATWDAEQNKSLTVRNWKVYTCPEATDPVNTVTTGYVGVAGLGPLAAELPRHDPRVGVFGYDRRTRHADFGDMLGNTLLLAETTTGGPWARGGPGTVRGFDPADRPHVGTGRPFGSFHRGGEAQPFGRTRPGCLVAVADAHVRFVTDRVAPETWEALATVNGGDVLPADW